LKIKINLNKLKNGEFSGVFHLFFQKSNNNPLGTVFATLLGTGNNLLKRWKIC